MIRTLYDTCYFMRLYSAKQPYLQSRLRMEPESRQGKCVSAITVYEVYRLSLQYESREIAEARKAAIERDFQVINVDSEIAAEAARIKELHGEDFPLADAIIGATASLHRMECVTNDNHIKLLGPMTRWLRKRLVMKMEGTLKTPKIMTMENSSTGAPTAEESA